jgi:hypothetical protein
MDSVAGFRIGLPAGWTQSISGLTARMNDASASSHLTVSLAAWKATRPLAEAQYLQKKDKASHAGYQKLVLDAAGFKSLGGNRSAPSAELEFSWRNASGVSLTELVIPVTLTTTAGSQPYLFSLWAPASAFSALDTTFGTALGTFHPLPAS